MADEVGLKFDHGKLPLELIPYYAVRVVLDEYTETPEFPWFEDLLGWYQGIGDLNVLDDLLLSVPSATWLPETLQVLDHGRRVYGEFNWIQVVDGRRRYTAAALRHLLSHMRGTTTDIDTGCSHLAHFRCNLLFLRHLAVRAQIGNTCY